MDLAHYALWRAEELTAEELLGALSLVPDARAEAERLEIGLVQAGREAGLTWTQIAEATGFRSPQACQQHVQRMVARRGETS